MFANSVKHLSLQVLLRSPWTKSPLVNQGISSLGAENAGQSPKRFISVRFVLCARSSAAYLVCTASYVSMWLWVKNRYPKWNPGKWQHGQTPVVPRWFNVDPHPCGHASLGIFWRALGRGIHSEDIGYVLRLTCPSDSTSSGCAFRKRLAQ